MEHPSLGHMVWSIILRTYHENARALAIEISGIARLGSSVQPTFRPPWSSLGNRLVKSHGPNSQNSAGEKRRQEAKYLKGSYLGDIVAVLLSVHVVLEPSRLGFDIVIVSKVDEAHLVVVAHDDGVNEITCQILLGEGLGKLGLLRPGAVTPEVLVATSTDLVQILTDFIDLSFVVVDVRLIVVVYNVFRFLIWVILKQCNSNGK